MEVYDAHFPAPKMIHVVQEWYKACRWWWILIGKLLIMGMGFFHWKVTCPASMAEEQLSLPEKEKWVVKTDLGTSKGRDTFELSWYHLPKQVAGWFLQSSCCRRHFHGLHEKSNPAFGLRGRAVCLPLSCEWKKKKRRKEERKKKTWEHQLMVGKHSV